MDLQLTSKVIIVTGGAKGIGEGIALALVHEGAIPVIIGRNKNDNQHLLDKIKQSGGTGFQIVAELTDDAECKYAIDQTIKQFGKIDGLVNNAGVNDGVGLANGNYEAFVSSLHKNLIHY